MKNKRTDPLSPGVQKEILSTHYKGQHKDYDNDESDTIMKLESKASFKTSQLAS